MTAVPPPIRRIVVDDEPNVVTGPAPATTLAPGGAPNAAGLAGTATAVATGAPAATGATHPGATQGPPGFVAAPRRRPASATALGVERMRTEDLTIAYDGKVAVGGVTLPVRQGEVLALIGPSGCGKTTLLRSLNRLIELTATATQQGRITLDHEDTSELEVTQLRRRVSMVFQQPNPFPMSVFDNVAYALREQGSGRPSKSMLEPAVGEALQRAGLWDEVGANLSHAALRLSGGQQQRLCIARALAARPEVLLLDEPCSALDPRSTQTIEDLIVRLREEVAIVIVTHNLQQAYRIADYVGFMYLGELVEYGPAEQMFGDPRESRTREYVSGAFG